MVSSLQSWQRVTATQGCSQRTARNHARIPLKTLEFLMFSNGPQPENSVSLEIPLPSRAESYVLWKTLKIIGKSMVPSFRDLRRVTASIVFSRQGTHGRVCCQKKDIHVFCPGILGNLMQTYANLWKANEMHHGPIVGNLSKINRILYRIDASLGNLRSIIRDH